MNFNHFMQSDVKDAASLKQSLKKIDQNVDVRIIHTPHQDGFIETLSITYTLALDGTIHESSIMKRASDYVVCITGKHKLPKPLTSTNNNLKNMEFRYNVPSKTPTSSKSICTGVVVLCILFASAFVYLYHWYHTTLYDIRKEFDKLKEMNINKN